MITQIGIVAGEIWHYLDKHGEVMLSDVLSNLSREKDLVLMSVGWLAREGYVVLEKKDSDFKVFLRKTDRIIP
ncbi:MAG: winged helix-turn-helix domain-containing protein [Candidatus Omnitrophica bacterium]|nr:winged helix-turn-helix domain-containing protein [Candidatus Omnitrophota bacterium]